MAHLCSPNRVFHLVCEHYAYIHMSMVIHMLVWNTWAQNSLLVHSSSVSCLSLLSQHYSEADPGKTYVQLGEQCQVVHWKPHHCHSLCTTYWHRRWTNSDGQRVRKAVSTPWSSHWPYVKPFHSLLPLKLISVFRHPPCSSLERMYFSLFIYWKIERPLSQWDHPADQI